MRSCAGACTLRGCRIRGRHHNTSPSSEALRFCAPKRAARDGKIPGVSQPLSYSPPEKTEKLPTAVWVLIWTLSGVLLLFLVTALLPDPHRPTKEGDRVKCASNLHEIGQTLLAYANSHDHQFPDSLPTLAAQSELGAWTFTC